MVGDFELHWPEEWPGEAVFGGRFELAETAVQLVLDRGRSCCGPTQGIHRGVRVATISLRSDWQDEITVDVFA